MSLYRFAFRSSCHLCIHEGNVQQGGKVTAQRELTFWVRFKIILVHYHHHPHITADSILIIFISSSLQCKFSSSHTKCLNHWFILGENYGFVCVHHHPSYVKSPLSLAMLYYPIIYSLFHLSSSSLCLSLPLVFSPSFFFLLFPLILYCMVCVFVELLIVCKKRD